MKQPLLLLALFGAILLSGCAAHSEGRSRRTVSIDSIFREHAGVIHQGMTRRHVYAVLPPYRTPIAYPPRMVAIIGMPLYSYHREFHRIDSQRYVEILYRLANRRDYPTSDLYPGKHMDVNQLLLGPKAEMPVLSVQNRRDVVYRVTDICPPGPPLFPHDVAAQLIQGSYYEVLLEKPPATN